MRNCKCGQPAKYLKQAKKFRCDECALKEGLLVECQGEAHSNPYFDNCWECAPRWGRHEPFREEART